MVLSLIHRGWDKGHCSASDIFKCNLYNENVWIFIKISLKFVPRFALDNSSALVKVKAWRQADDKPIYEPMMAWFIDADMRHLAFMS